MKHFCSQVDRVGESVSQTCPWEGDLLGVMCNDESLGIWETPALLRSVLVPDVPMICLAPSRAQSQGSNICQTRAGGGLGCSSRSAGTTLVVRLNYRSLSNYRHTSLISLANHVSWTHLFQWHYLTIDRPIDQWIDKISFMLITKSWVVNFKDFENHCWRVHFSLRCSLCCGDAPPTQVRVEFPLTANHMVCGKVFLKFFRTWAIQPN